jgi:hypothetical protein
VARLLKAATLPAASPDWNHKIQVRLGRTDPAFATLLIEAAQTLIDTFSP